MPTFLDNLTEYNAKASLAISQAVADGNTQKANMMSSLKSTANDTTLTEAVRLNALTALINLGSLLTIPLPPYFPVVTTYPDTQVYVGLHNELSGLQGGQAGEYYHLTQAQWTALGSAASAADISFENLQGVYTDNNSLVGGFNSKQDALSGTGFVKISGTTISYDNSVYLTSSTGIASAAAFGGEVSGTYNNLTLVNNAVIGKTLTGWNGSATYSAITSSDTILSGMEKLNARISGIISNPAGVASVVASTNASSVISISPTIAATGAVNVSVNLQSQTQNKFLASPNGSAGVPSFRAIAVDDLPASAVTPAQYGSSTLIPQVTVDAKGRITAITTVAAASGGQVNSVTFSGPGGVFLDSNTGTATDPIVGFTLDDVLANYVWAGPSSGPVGQPDFRALVLDDIAGITIPQSQIDGLTETLSTFLTGSLANSTMYIGNVSDAAVNAIATGDLSLAYVDNNGTNEAQFTINNGVVSYAKIQNVTAQTLLGRYSLTNGAIQELTLSPSYFTINNTTGEIGLVSPIASILTTKGDILTHTGTNLQRLGIGANATIFMADTAASTGNKWVAMSGDVSIATSGATTIANNAVTFAKMQTIADGRILGNNSGGTAVPSELTGATVTTLLSQFDTTSTAQGVVPGSNNLGSTYFLDGSGNWSQPAGSGTIYSAAQYSIPYYSDSPTGIALSGLAPQTTNGVYFLRANVTASAAVAPDWIGSTGSGSVVLATSPTLVTPNIGVATATSINGLTISTTTGTLTLANGSTLATAGAFSTTLTATATTNVTLPTTGTLATLAGVETFDNKTLNTPKIGQGAGQGHFHMHFSNSAPTGLNNYVTVFADTSPNKNVGFLFELDGFESYFQFNAASTSKTYTFPDATGTVALIDASNVLNVPKSGSTSGAIALGGGTSGTITLQAPATITGTGTYTMPAAYPAAASGYYLTSNTSGVLSWVSVTGGGDVTSTATGTPQGNFAIFDDNTGKVINTSSVASLGASPSGRATFNNGVDVGVSSSTTGTLVFRNATTSATTTLLASTSQSVNLSYTWPSTAPAAGNILSSDASGNLSWTAAGAGNMVLATAGQVVTGSKIYADGTLLIRNPAATFSTTLSAGASTGNWTATFPNATGTVAFIGLAQSFTAAQTFTGGVTISTAALSVSSAATFSLSAATGTALTINAAAGGTTNPVLSIGAVTTAAFMSFPNFYIGSPSTTRNAGTKIILYPVASSVDNAIGYDGNGPWVSSAAIGGTVSFYNSTTLAGQFTNGYLNFTQNTIGINFIPTSLGTGNWINFAGFPTGTGTPNLTARASGTRIILYPNFLASTRTDYAIGFSGNELWFGASTSSGTFGWYSDATRVMTLNNTGVLNLSVSTGRLQINGTQVVGVRETGYTAFTGTTNKATSYATGTVTLIQLAERVAAIQASLTTHGLIGA